MVNRRNRELDLNKDGNVEFSESCKDLNQKGKKECDHVTNAVNLARVKKEIKKTGIKNECTACRKSGTNSPQVDEEGFEPCIPKIWMCLQCGNEACGRNDKNHGMEHYKTPHSDCHCLAINTINWDIWCYECDKFLEVNHTKKLFDAVECLKKISVSNLRQTLTTTSQVILQKEFAATEKKQKILFGLTKVVGLANLGNTCFFNAVLQCLAQTPFLVKVLEDLQKPGQTFVLPGGKFKKPGDSEEIILPPIEGTLEYKDSYNFTQTLQKTLTEMQNANGQQSYIPSELLSSFRKKTSECMDGGQHDSHELLRHLLEIVRNEDLRRYQSVILKELEIKVGKPKNNLSDPIKEVDEDKVSKLKFYGHQASARLLGPEPVFRGVLVSTLECLECHHSSQRTEPFLDLSLPVMVDKPQPPVFKRKNSGFEDAFDMMSSNSSNNVSKPLGKKEIRIAKKTARKQEKNNQYALSRNLDNSLENNDSANGESSSRVSVGSDTDVEDNVETESGTEPLLKSQEIVESGYSSEKASALTSPVSPATNDANSSLCSINDQLLPLGSSISFSPLKDNGSLENKDLVSELETRTSENLINSPIKFGESPMSLLGEKNSEKTIVEDERSSEIEDKEKFFESVALKRNTDIDPSLVTFFGAESESEVSSPENKNNISTAGEAHSSTNGVAKITSNLFRMGLNHTSQSPTRYSTNEGEFSIQSCLNQFTHLELMSGNNKVGCEACTAKENKGKEKKKMVCTPSTKQYLISKVPAVLILHLKRFQSQRIGFKKVTKHVNFPVLLDLAPVCKNYQKSIIYSLYGVVEHSGTLYGGHYVAYVKTRQPLQLNDPRWSFLPTKETKVCEGLLSDTSSGSESEGASAENTKVESPPGRWYHISDSRVSEVDESAVLQLQAYLLFYERIL